MSEIIKLNDGTFIRIERIPFSMVHIAVVGTNIGCNILFESNEFERFLNRILQIRKEMEGEE